MIGLNLNGTYIATDDEGYLLNPQDCSPELAELLANSIDLELTEERLQDRRHAQAVKTAA